MTIRVIHGDMREELPKLGRAHSDGASVHSIVTDPPYHLTTPTQRSHMSGQTMGNSEDTPFKRNARGFMGKAWDGGDIAFQAATWRLCFDLLPPGGHLLAFAGTRTYHRMACAIEDAGFELRDTIAWLYGSGFPKSHNVSKGIDKKRDDNADIERVRSWLEQRRQAAGITRAAVNDALGVASNGGGLMSSWTTNQTSHAVPQWEQWLQLKTLLAFGDEMDGEVWRLNDRKGTPGEAWADREFYDEPTGGLHGGSGNTVGAFNKGRQAKPGGATDAAREAEYVADIEARIAHVRGDDTPLFRIAAD